jgi:hypothetical protein
MYVAVTHEISDPEKFMSNIVATVKNLPDGVRAHQGLVNPTGTKASCLWEADSIQHVRDVIEGAVGAFSTNEYFEVDEKTSVGLPA